MSTSTEMGRIEARIPKGDGWYPRVSVGEGWHPVIAALDAEIGKLKPDYRVLQVKEKFGGLRYYIDSLDATTRPLIAMAESICWAICEACGRTGTLRTDIIWVRTLCEECHEASLHPGTEQFRIFENRMGLYPVPDLIDPEGA